MYGCDFQMAVLTFMALYARGVLCVFFHVVELLMGNDAGGPDRLADVPGERDSTVAAVNFPGTAIPPGQKILVAALRFREAAGDRPDLGFGFVVGEGRGAATAQKEHTGKKYDGFLHSLLLTKHNSLREECSWRPARSQSGEECTGIREIWNPQAG